MEIMGKVEKSMLHSNKSDWERKGKKGLKRPGCTRHWKKKLCFQLREIGGRDERKALGLSWKGESPEVEGSQGRGVNLSSPHEKKKIWSIPWPPRRKQLEREER